MPSNHILINNALECFVSDNKMEELMQYLRQNAYDWRETPNRLAEFDSDERVTYDTQTVA